MNADDDRQPGEEQAPGEGLPAPREAGRDRELWVGVFFLVGLVATITALFMLTDAAMFRGRYIVHTTLPSAGGIRKGDPVQMRGVNVGRILRFRISSEGVRIDLEVEGEYLIPADSHVMLRSAGLLGGMVADVVPGDDRRVLSGGESLPGEVEAAMMDTANRISAQAETVLGRMQTLLSPATIKNVEASSVEAREVLTRLNATAAEQRKELLALTRSLRETSAKATEAATGVSDLARRAEIDRSLKRLDTLTARLDETSASLDRAVKASEVVLGRMERGEGTLGKLSRDSSLYDSLNEAAANVSRLAEDVRKQPKRYLDVSVF